MIDWAKVRMLRHEVGEEDFSEVIEIFLAEATEITDKLRNAQDPRTLGEDLHALKGSALNLGLGPFAEMCQAGETRAAQGRAGDVATAPILECYEESRRVLLAGLENGLGR